MTKTFSIQQKVLFKHCDPAGIVFYPRYFEMMNDCVESFFDEAIGLSFESLLLTSGVPTAEIHSRFRAPSRHGDRLRIELLTKSVGRTSWRYVMTASCQGELRFETEATLVYVDPEGKPCAWPDQIREKLQKYEAPNDT